jgi:PRTRC genetic system protein E
MFQELMPLLQRREKLSMSLIANGDKITIIVLPEPGTMIKEPTEAQVAALKTPFTLTGLPEDLDKGIVNELLKDYDAQHRSIEAQALEMKEQMAAAAAKMEEERKEKMKSRHVSGSKSKTEPATAKKPDPPVPPDPPKKPLPPSLFDAPADAPKEEPEVEPESEVEPAIPSVDQPPVQTETAESASDLALVSNDEDDEELELLRTPIDEPADMEQAA